MDNITVFKDANGKEISINLSTLTDFNEDMDNGTSVSLLKDMKRNRTTIDNTVKFYDSNGNEMTQDAVTSANNNGNVTGLTVEMEASHSGPNHNYIVYYEDSMEKDAVSFVNPFKKPVLKNHNSCSGEPIGRVQNAWTGPSNLTQDRSAIHLQAKIIDKDAISKFLDNRYSTVSIGGTMGTVTCNICGKTILKNGKFNFCGHWRGETYKDNVCYWGVKDIEYNEVSVVNVPADDFAQVTKITVLTDKTENSVKEDNNVDSIQNNQPSADSIKQSALQMVDMIDKLLGNTAAVKDSVNTSLQQNEQVNPAQQTGSVIDTTNNPVDTKDMNSNASDVEDEQYQNTINNLNSSLTDANNTIKTLEAKITDMESKLAKAENDLIDAQNEAKSMKDMCLTLAASNKEMLVDKIINKERITNDNVQTRKDDLMAKSMKELSSIANSIEQQPRVPAQVTNPGLADTSKDDNTFVDKKNNNNDKKRTVDDFATDIIGKLFNK